MRLFQLACLVVALVAGVGCTSEQKDLLELNVDPPSRKAINRDILGVNNFFNQPQFGSIDSQFSEIRDTLGIRFVRVLISWNDGVQPSPSSEPNYGLFDDIIESVPSGVDILPVVVHTPTWMTNSANWVDGNPRETWVERFFRPTVARYARNRRIIGWEIWNEPDLTVVPSDDALGLTTPENYMDLLRRAAPVVRDLDPAKLVVIAATRSIQQDYPRNLDYNKQLRALGAEALVDIWNVHYYGEQFENVVRDNGVRDFLNSLSKPIWITESGKQGPTDQLDYVETVWPFLTEEISGIERIYYYEFASSAPLPQNFGLKTSDPGLPVSDFYIFLRDNKR